MRPRPVLNLLLSHQRGAALEALLRWWGDFIPAGNLLVAAGGRREDFEKIQHPHKVFVGGDPRLRTLDHQRERQSYAGVFAAATRWLSETGKDPAGGADPEFIHFVEYDHLPLAPDLNARQVAALEAERADVLGFHLARVDGTSHPHYLYHAHEEWFPRFWAETTCRSDPGTVLTMFGSGSFWTRKAFEAVAAVPEPRPVYLELWLPTLAHHLGFRVRPFTAPEAAAHIRATGDWGKQLDAVRAAGAWSVHPVKFL